MDDAPGGAGKVKDGTDEALYDKTNISVSSKCLVGETSRDHFHCLVIHFCGYPVSDIHAATRCLASAALAHDTSAPGATSRNDPCERGHEFDPVTQ